MVARVRRVAGQKRVGHAGTLDPIASGVLPVLLGRATRLADYIQQGRKTYVATVHLGVSTDTDDAEGRVVGEQPVPRLSRELIETALAGFKGDILQKPPAYSALKVSGQRAYAVARAGGEVDLASRPVTIYDLRLLDWSAAELSLEVTCSRGTYVRALARDIVLALGSVGHMAALVRTAVGPFRLDDALTLDDIAARGVEHALLPASHALPDAPCLSADADQTKKLVNGQPVPLATLRTAPPTPAPSPLPHGQPAPSPLPLGQPAPSPVPLGQPAPSPLPLGEAARSAGEGCLRAESVWVYDPAGALVCLATADGAMLRPRLVL